MTGEQMLMVKIADLYHVQGMTQQAIADRLDVSRPTISRLLRRAKAEGIVRIEIAPPEGTHRPLERQLEDRHNLREAIVVTGRPEAPTATRRALGLAAAAYLSRILKPGGTIGISWGATLAAVVAALAPHRLSATIVPLVGGVGRAAPDIHANELGRQMAAVLGGEVQLLHAPAIVSHSSVREALFSDPRIREVMSLARRADVALVGIGALIQSSSLVQSGYFSPEELKGLHRRGAVGDICTRAFTIDGMPVDSVLDKRILAVELADLRRIPMVIAVAGGLEKADAIAGALRGGLVNVLVTDHLAARAVLRASNAEKEVAR